MCLFPLSPSIEFGGPGPHGHTKNVCELGSEGKIFFLFTFTKIYSGIKFVAFNIDLHTHTHTHTPRDVEAHHFFRVCFFFP